MEHEHIQPEGADDKPALRSREDDSHTAEMMGYAMKPGMDDAQRLDAMADEALAQSRERKSTEQWALQDKANDLERAANSSRDAAEEAARRARDQVSDLDL